jgi:vacuolar-type H+-ATPase subunit H
MTQSTLAPVEPSPLDQIRQAEVTAARRVAAARQAAQDAIREAHEQAAELKCQAREYGCLEGLEEYEVIVSSAEREAQTVREEAHSQARDLHRRGDLFGETAVRYAVMMVTGQETGER